MKNPTLTLTLVTTLAVSLASCSKEEAPATSQSKTAPKSESASAVAAPAPPPVPVTAEEPAKEAPPKAAPLKEELEVVTPSTSVSHTAVETEKAKLQAEQNALKEQQAKAAATNDEAQKAELANRMKEVEQKIKSLPRPDLGEGFEARGVSEDDGTRAALDKLLNNAPKNAPAPGSSPPAPTPVPAAPKPAPEPVPFPATNS
ncbi:hypothetical protein DES53_11365 [Roseimicrobium gellanilyticum]|uniref:Uncharacterized protein n=1 Tax=Roseimicrobium gellanilyticum TaxID=748857 RepID=A0A366H6Q8_9BACT|nr:hypothetical protein [Roseimicrobium gellanilyticum]RBP37683.1 hypothetical protein DES53_11365 [Roseimicrobium gellanilyticum]